MCGRSPHTRGDGPCSPSGWRLGMAFSPHAWGWSAAEVRIRELEAVLPTRVGMVRHARSRHNRNACSPHTRGDGPRARILPLDCGSFSPHAWGWSGRESPFLAQRWVLPTRVGMVRGPSGATGPSGGSPHTRGDGPRSNSWLVRQKEFSPHAWGWSVEFPPQLVALGVLPTRVGMVRDCGDAFLPCNRSPHTRGDGPISRSARSNARLFSPHAWGWSGPSGATGGQGAVLPTRVGMVRLAGGTCLSAPGSPHTRGDGPPRRGDWRVLARFSPHAWGWSDFVCIACANTYVLPTRVGMVRLSLVKSCVVFCSPHTRGDGPRNYRTSGSPTVFSPHAWGWSGRNDHIPDAVKVLPTRVGMVRKSN